MLTTFFWMDHYSCKVRSRGKKKREDFFCLYLHSIVTNQLAELKAVTTVCQLAKGQIVSIITDSAYAHGVCHRFVAVWKQCGFKKHDGMPSNIPVMMHLNRLALIKYQAHKKGKDFYARLILLQIWRPKRPQIAR